MVAASWRDRKFRARRLLIIGFQHAVSRRTCFSTLMAWIFLSDEVSRTALHVDGIRIRPLEALKYKTVEVLPMVLDNCIMHITAYKTGGLRYVN